jgi:hypothetical protein
MSVEEWTLIISGIAAIAAVVSAGASIYLVRQRPQIKVDWPEQPIDYEKRGGPPTYAQRFDGTLRGRVVNTGKTAANGVRCSLHFDRRYIEPIGSQVVEPGRVIMPETRLAPNPLGLESDPLFVSYPIEIPVRIHLSGRTSIDYRVVSDEGNKIADQLTVDVVAKT